MGAGAGGELFVSRESAPTSGCPSIDVAAAQSRGHYTWYRDCLCECAGSEPPLVNEGVCSFFACVSSGCRLPLGQ